VACAEPYRSDGDNKFSSRAASVGGNRRTASLNAVHPSRHQDYSHPLNAIHDEAQVIQNGRFNEEEERIGRSQLVVKGNTSFACETRSPDGKLVCRRQIEEAAQ
jgi:hypothetical protein